MRLGTFVHVSDLHFGNIDSKNQIVYDAKAPWLIRKLKCIDGLWGHSYRALVRLEEFFSRMNQAEQAKLIVTGDVTCVGAHAQFALAKDYLGSIKRFPNGVPLGLRAADWEDRMVPGNHDHWPGLALIVGPPIYLQKNNPGLPQVSAPVLLPNGVALRFFRINTDGDVGSYSLNRVLARGKFHNHLKAVPTMANAGEIRVLLLHHSVAHRGITLSINSRSRKALEKFLVQQDISIILTGHTHVPLVKPFSASHDGKTLNVLEASSGTTTQLDEVPKPFRSLFASQPNRKIATNTLIVHRLMEENNKIFWDAKTYSREPNGFVLKGPSDKVEVWPRP